MSRTFDEAVESAWARFEERVAVRVPAIGLVDCTIERAGPGERKVPLVSLEGWDDHVSVELVGLSGAHDLAAVEALGWRPPEEPEDSPFWAVAMPVGESAVLAGMLSGVLRCVFGVTHPAFLVDDLPGSSVPAEQAGSSGAEPGARDDRVPRSGETSDDPGDGDHDEDDQPVIGYPESSEELVEMVRRTLAHAYGTEVCRDDDGDFPISARLVPFWVRVLDDAPVVRVFGFPVRSVRDVRQGRVEVGVLNRRTSLLKFRLEDGVITLTCDLPAVPFVGSQLTHVLDCVTRWLDDLAEDTALRVGGRLWSSATEGRGSGSEREGP